MPAATTQTPTAALTLPSPTRPATAPACPPQLIVHLGVPADDPQAPDWGSIAVYCCSASCGAGLPAGGAAAGAAAAADESAYLEEFVWVQESA